MHAWLRQSACMPLPVVRSLLTVTLHHNHRALPLVPRACSSVEPTPIPLSPPCSLCASEMASFGASETFRVSEPGRNNKCVRGDTAGAQSMKIKVKSPLQ